MAIKRLDPKAIFKVISATDASLVTESDEEMFTGEKEADGTPRLKRTRYEDYIEGANLDESKLLFQPGQQPDRILLRPLTADENADIQSRYVLVDTVAKKVVYTNRHKMFLEMFSRAYQGIEGGEGKVEKADIGEIPFQVQMEMGAVVSLITSLDKNTKKS